MGSKSHDTIVLIYCDGYPVSLLIAHCILDNLDNLAKLIF